MKNTIIMSLGGSVIVPDKVDVKFVKDFKKIIEKFVKKNYRFVILCGGGKTARNYQNAASKISKLSNDELDRVGIHATVLNAQFVKMLFGNLAEDYIVIDPTKKIKFEKNILIAAGWKPGWSTDYDAVLLAKNFGVDKVINMSNIDYVYDKDPSKDKSARKIKNISWSSYRKISGNEWKAGLNKPFDPIASKEAQKLKLKVIVIGRNLKNFENLVNNKKFDGTVIR